MGLLVGRVSPARDHDANTSSITVTAIIVAAVVDEEREQEG